MAVKGNDLAQHEIESVLLKKFGKTLTKGTLTWYSLLPEHSINSFEMLADSFIKAHAGDKKVQARKARIAQGEFQLLREFDRDKNWDKFKDDFDADRRSSKGRFLPYERAKRHDSKGFRSSDRFAPDRRTDRGCNNQSLQEKEVSGTRDSSYPKLSYYNINISVVELASKMRNIEEAQFSRPIRTDPNQRDPKLRCEYHGTRGHRTGDCRHLREEVATLLKNDHLFEFLSDWAKNNYSLNRDNAEPSQIGEGPPQLVISGDFDCVLALLF
nr:uncharacterized protein LOC104096060 [Nicotiana tomentosiformis]